MQLAIADLLAAPWAVLPDRLPFVPAAIDDSFAYGRVPPHAPRAGSVNAVHCKAGNGAIAVLRFYGIAVQRTDAFVEAQHRSSLSLRSRH
ncbi:hypothetical protein [Burkholderia pseudomallei]|uniref:hypothetical protein n=1 Tax=Burkholderia pseudomallei TaxID=28450 RepID=UPI0004F69630|nr:hypothetical protein [Burkholderia pseudomallei]AIP70117.1 hypothetical protein DU27_1211 [Burkholderia pseudomallei]AJW92755.1 hypothetical protein BG92_138 [Burkholderia pseudomallei 406e]CAJ3956480.1 peptidase S49 [Burkholderia pseudomallei]CAJ4605098.1 peptidase S49 [Burkholderia pseudomallei]CAJ4877851.1 peptidase S49 [Burkholderia pseudomallei]